MKYPLVLIGSGEFAIPCFERLSVDPRFDIKQVVTQPPKPGQRGLTVIPTPVAVWAGRRALPIYAPPNLTADTVVSEFKKWSAAAYIIIAYGLILPETILRLPTSGCLNVHASLLPKYRGAAPIAAAIINGDERTGVTVMKMDAGIDTGPIISQTEVGVDPADTALTLSAKLSAAAAQVLPVTLIAWLEHQVTAKPQPKIGGSYVKKITKDDGRADWKSGLRLARLVRAYQPWPGVWTTWRGQILKFIAAEFIAADHELTPGQVVKYQGSWTIVCADGYFQPREVQFSGKKTQPANNVPGGYPGFLGSQLPS